MIIPSLCFEDIEVGVRLPELRRRPSTVQLFRFSAVTWNAHRIHYEREYALREGYAGVLVHSQLHGCFLAQIVTDWMGPQGRLTRFSWKNKMPAAGGTELISRGTVSRVYSAGGVGLVDVDLEELDEHGVLCVSGTATVILPPRAKMADHAPQPTFPKPAED